MCAIADEINRKGAKSAKFFAYRSYLVRFWQSNEQGCWRASAQCVQTGNTVLFGSVERLFAFLNTEIAAKSNSEDASSPDLPAPQP